MSALNMAMNGNAYKMIEIKKVSGPVVPLSSLNPLTTLTDRYEPLPSGPNQRTFTDLTSLNHNPAYNLAAAAVTSHSQAAANGSLTTYTPAPSNGSATLGRQHAMPPPPPSREATLARERDPGAGAGRHLAGPGHNMADILQSRPALASDPPPPSAAAPPNKPSEETNGVALVSQQELDFNSKEEEKWWWVCCLEFCFCLL